MTAASASSQPPSIAPSQSSPAPTPFWSVMIPTYRPSEAFLRETLSGLLPQDPGADRMQIEVVDDCSPDVDVREMVERLGGGRVQFRRTERNLGLAGCWNACIGHARGRWVHLLHQDDLVYPGFYRELESLVSAAPSAGAVFTRHATTDAAGHWKTLSPLERAAPGVIDDWANLLVAWQRVQCVAIAVRRECYEQLGGFRNDLPYTLDWEMWNRIARHFAFAFSPRILAAYRIHESSESSRLQARLQILPDFIAAVEQIIPQLPPAKQRSARAAFSDRFTERLLWEAGELLRQRKPAAARALFRTYRTELAAGRLSEIRFLQLRCLVQQFKSLIRST